MFRHKTHTANHKGQSTVEYIVLVSAVLAVVILFAGRDGIFGQKMMNSLNEATDGITQKTDDLSATFVTNAVNVGPSAINVDPTANVFQPNN